MSFLKHFFLGGLLAAAFALPTAAGAAPEFELVFQNANTPTHINQKALRAWVAEVEEKCGGRVKINIVDNNAITSRLGAYQGLKDGAVDIAVFEPSITPNEMPLLTLLNMPFLAGSIKQNAKLFYAAIDQFPEMKAELGKGGEFLAAICSGSMTFASTAGQTVTKPEDIKGKRVVVWSTELTSAEVQDLGGLPTYLAVTDTYVGMQRGMGDMAYINFPTLRTLKLNEVVKAVSHLFVNNALSVIAVNRDVWNELPEDIQKIFKETAGPKLTDQLAANMTESEQGDLQKCKDEGINVYALTADEAAAFRSIMLAEGTKTQAWLETSLEKACLKDGKAWIKKMYEFAETVK